MEATIEKEKVVQIKLDDLKNLCDGIQRSYNLFTVLDFALRGASTWEDGISQEMVCGMSDMVFKIDEVFGVSIIDFKKLIKEVTSHE